MTEPRILWDADFDPKIKSYYLWSTSLILCITIVGIPIAIVYVLIGNWLISKHIKNLGCALSERTLDIKKGILNKTESTIPLEKITDLQMFQGPIMRHFGLHGFKVETAGQSSGPGGSLVNIIGIVDAIEFRKAVLNQRDTLAGTSSTPAPSPMVSAAQTGDDSAKILAEIRDVLVKIESKMDA
jgi:putative membrane protein